LEKSMAAAIYASPRGLDIYNVWYKGFNWILL